MIEVEKKGNYVHEINFVASRWKKKHVLHIGVAFEFKNRAKKNTFTALGKSSRADLLETAAARGKFRGHLQVSGKPWEGPERGGILDSLFYGESKNVREDPGDHISSHSPWGPRSLLAAGPREVKGQWTTGMALPMPAVERYYSHFIFGNSLRVKEAMPVGPPISILSTNRSRTESWSLAMSVDRAKIGWSQMWTLWG